MSNKPHSIKSAACLGLELACWTSDDGKISFSINKRYKDKNTEEWKDTKYLNSGDLAGLLEIANKGLAWAGKYYEAKRAAKDGAAPSAHGQAQAPRPAPTGGMAMQQAVPFDDDDIPF